MTKYTSFASRIIATLDAVKNFLTRRVEIAENAKYRAIHLERGRRAIEDRGAASMREDNIVAITLALIDSGKNTHDELVRGAHSYYRCSHKHAGWLLGQHAGDDPAKHLWSKEGKHYRLI